MLISKEELRKILSKYKKEDIEFGKDLSYLCFRNGCSKEEFIKEIFALTDVEIIEKQERGEERFVIYLIYSKSKGRAYVLRFYPQKIRVITIFPLGRRTLSRYFKRKFKKDEKPK